MENSNKKTILVVDDTTENIDVLVGILKGEYKVKVALNGEKALKIAQSAKPPNLILLDVIMPGMDGFEVCRKLKADSATQDIPVIFVTGNQDSEEKAQGLALGAADYLTKPVDAAVVVALAGKYTA